MNTFSTQNKNRENKILLLHQRHAEIIESSWLLFDEYVVLSNSMKELYILSHPRNSAPKFHLHHELEHQWVYYYPRKFFQASIAWSYKAPLGALSQGKAKILLWNRQNWWTYLLNIIAPVLLVDILNTLLLFFRAHWNFHFYFQVSFPIVDNSSFAVVSNRPNTCWQHREFILLCQEF